MVYGQSYFLGWKHQALWQWVCVACMILAMGVILWVPELPGQVFKPNKLIVTISDTPDPAAIEGEVKYQIGVKNDGRYRSFDVQVEIPIPGGTEFIQCTTSINGGACHKEGDTVVATLGTLRAHQSVTVSLTLKMPPVATEVTLTATATGEQAFKGDSTETTAVLAPYTSAVLLPSGGEKIVACGDTLGSSFFGSDTVVQLLGALSCTDVPFGLRVNASGVTLDLNGKKILNAVAKGTVGIAIGAGATGVTIVGGSTAGTSGIEFFDWCVKDEGGNEGLVVKQLRCFRARSAGIDITSDGVEIANSLIDNTVPGNNSTAELPGGVGIRARGDNIRVKDTIVRRSKVVGIWADGLDTDGSGRVVTIDGNAQSMKVERNFGIGILLENGPHLVKGARISADGPDAGTSTDGVVVAANGAGNVLDGISVRNHKGNGVVVEGTDTLIERSGVEAVGGHGFLVKGSGTVLNGSQARVPGDGFVIEGPDNKLTTNSAEGTRGNGFVVTGARAMLSGNKAKSNGKHGYILASDNGAFNSNSAEGNTGNGFIVSGNGNKVGSSSSKTNAGVGIEVTGSANTFNTNNAEGNGGFEWVIAAGNFDDGGNRANGGRVSFTTAAGGTFE